MYTAFYLSTVVAIPIFVSWELERRSRVHYLAVHLVPLDGTFGSFYMGSILLWGCLIAWLLVALDI